MAKFRTILTFFVIIASIQLNAQESSKLQPTKIIGTPESVDYSDFTLSMNVNTIADAFDGNLNSFFASYVRSGGWVGLDLGEKHVITKIAVCPRRDHASRLLLGVFEGANTPDFTDAIPIYMIKETPEDNKMTEYTINCSRGFRYVRYIGPNDLRCNIAEIEFHGYADDGDDSKLYQITNIPDVIIHTYGAIDITDPYKEVYRSGIISVISDNGETIYTDKLEIRGRGNNSWTHPKKPYRLKLDKKTNLLGLPAKAKNWTLINNYGDKTLMRNYLAFDLSERMELEYTPAIKFVNVFLNGEYKGCYQLCDQIEVDENRINVEEMSHTDMQLPALSGGYLLEIDAYAYSEISWFESNQKTPVTIKYPKDDEIVPPQAEYIKNWFNNMETAIYSMNFKDPNIGYRKYLDTESFIRHFLVSEISGNTDTYWSVYMYKKRNNDLFYFGPIWDCDLAYENDRRTYPINSKSDWIYATNGSHAKGVKDLVNKLFTDEAFSNQVKSIYAKYRNSGVISEEALLAVVSDAAEQLDESQKLNFTRWKIMQTTIHENPRIHGSYDAEVENVKGYIRARIAWMDNKLKYVPGTGNTNFEKEDDFNEIKVWNNNNAIHIEGITQPAKIEVVTIDGKTVYSQMANNSSVDIALPKGLYIVKISNSKGNSKSIKCML